MKTKYIKPVYFIAIFFILSVLGIICLVYLRKTTAPVNAMNFLKEYYTVQEYKGEPEDLEYMNKMREMYKTYVTDTEIERMIANRTILQPVLTAQKRKCTLRVAELKLWASKEDNLADGAVYEYRVNVEVTYPNNQKMYIEQTGQLRMNDSSEEAIITCFSPYALTSQMLKLL